MSSRRTISFILLLVFVFALGVRAGPTQVFLLCMRGRNLASVVLQPGTQAFQAAVRGSWVSNAGWNPIAFATVRSPSEIRQALICAAQAGVGVCPRTGGHSKMGHSLCNGVVIDLWKYRGIRLNKSKVLVSIKGGTTLGEVMYLLANSGLKQKFIPTGECPQVGTSGFFLGGGLTEFDGQYGLGCDNLVSIRYALANATLVYADKSRNKELFWASCGGGGGSFGIAYEFTFKIRDRTPYDKSVYFRFDWDVRKAAQIIRGYHAWDLGDGWISMKLKSKFHTSSPVIQVFGVCWNVQSTSECLTKLEHTPVFAVPGGTQKVFKQATNMLEVMKFLGKPGRYAQAIPRQSDTQAFLGQNFASGSKSNAVRWASTIMTFPNPLPPLSYFQGVVDYCSLGGVSTCNWRRIGKSVSKVPVRATAFAHRKATDVLYVSISNSPKSSQLLTQFVNYFKRYTRGSYLNYPNADLPHFRTLYWGANLRRLQRLKRALDPFNFFLNPQSLLDTPGSRPRPPP